jgi:threonine/homoserine/homoserine lactone efflux protein
MRGLRTPHPSPTLNLFWQDRDRMLLMFLLKGIAVGTVIAVPVGPVGILCVRRTIFKGRLSGFASGLGAATADAVFGIVAGFGLGFVSDLLLGYQGWLRLGGAGFLIYAGGSALAQGPVRARRANHRREGLLGDFISTFALTITNPITILVFLGIFAAVGLSGQEATLARAGALVLGVWVGSSLWWLALVGGAGAFLHSLEERHLRWIARGSGGILVLSGGALLAALAIEHL